MTVQRLSGTEGVEGGNGPGYRVLPSHEGISRGRTLRDDEPDSSFGSFDSSEYRRGTRPGTYEGVPQPREYRQGIAQGTGNAPTPLSARRIAQGSRSTVSDDVVRPDQPDALTSPPSSRTKALTPHASGPTPHAPRPPSRLTLQGDGSGIKRHRLPPLGKSCTSHRRSLDCGRAATSDLASSPARSFQL